MIFLWPPPGNFFTFLFLQTKLRDWSHGSKRCKLRGAVPCRLLRHCSCSARGARHAPVCTMKVRPLPPFFSLARQGDFAPRRPSRGAKLAAGGG
jgi:hypothetical protein